MADPSYRAAQPGEFFCPAGGTWYMCETGTKFVGCCIADPCTNGCIGNSLRPAGRSTALDSQSPGGSCGGQTPFWTCGQAPTFWGCCNENPCMNNSTCPEGKLEPTFWDRPDQYEYFKDLNILLSSTAPRSTSTSLSGNSHGSSGPSDAVIGGAVGGTLGFVAIIAFVIFLLWRRKRRSQKQANSDPALSMEENKPETGELASPVSDSTVNPMYSWNVANNSPAQQRWAHNHREVPGEDSKGSPRSPYTELHSNSSHTRVAELPAGTVANELDAPEYTPKSPYAVFGIDVPKQAHSFDAESQGKPMDSREKR
ncbi:hypothetical protein C7974DRAFT_7055 [Boeremia exigua]|uniref:uncharacterized protein n=1 Tax=Boeremia exigua TaxID=749465 RepID=UPI001E8D38B6|nr:uncharacterized protein C7974DRAFT_7055 [Boeremia exigua]KAH6643814.1 hypothetical protein C7974DRAFT_7055 [Boeremia exigua]